MQFIKFKTYLQILQMQIVSGINKEGTNYNNFIYQVKRGILSIVILRIWDICIIWGDIGNKFAIELCKNCVYKYINYSIK